MEIIGKETTIQGIMRERLNGQLEKRTALEETNPAGQDDKKLMKACEDFEALFLSHLMKTMRTSTVEESGMFGDGLGGDLFHDLFESEVARKMAGAGGMGLAKVLYESMKGRMQPEGDRPVKEFIPEPLNAVPETAMRRDVPASFERIRQFDRHIGEAARSFGVDPDLIYAVIQQESSGYVRALSQKGAKGLMQLMDETASDLGVKNSFDPEENIRGGTRYLRAMLDRFDGDIRLALAAYNAGPGTVERYGGIPPYRETMHYVDRVLEYYAQVRGMNTITGRKKV